MSECPTFSVISGTPIRNIDKYSGFEIIFQNIEEKMVNPKNKYDPFKVKNYMAFNIKTSNQELGISLTKDNKIIGPKRFQRKNIDGDHYYVDKIELDDMMIKIFSSVIWPSVIKRKHNGDIPFYIDQMPLIEIKGNLFLIGNGAQGTVVKFEKDGVTYALKIIKFFKRKNFVRELVIYLMIKHPNIAKMVGYSFIFDNTFGFVLEFAENLSLEKYSNEHDIKKLFVKCMTSISSALAHLHSYGIMHRDIKPANILVDRNLNFKLTDFDISITFDDIKYLNYGTTNYEAPETLKGPYNNLIDVFSAGVVAIFLIDRKNFVTIKESIRNNERIKNIPYETQIILRDMLSDPTNRPTFREILILLKEKLFFIDESTDNISYKDLTPEYETGNDYINYLNSKNCNNLFRCLMFHVFHGEKEMIGNISRLGQLLDDEFMSYYFDNLVLTSDSVAYEIGLSKKTNIFDRYLRFSSRTYKFLLMPPPDQMRMKLKFDRKLMSKNENRETSANMLKNDAEHRSKDKSCFMCLNDLALNGHRKSCYHLARVFFKSNNPQKFRMANYFLSLSNIWLAEHGLLDKYKLKVQTIKKDMRKIDFVNQFNDDLPIDEENEAELFKLARVYPNLLSIFGLYIQKAYNEENLAKIYKLRCENNKNSFHDSPLLQETKNPRIKRYSFNSDAHRTEERKNLINSSDSKNPRIKRYSFNSDAHRNDERKNLKNSYDSKNPRIKRYSFNPGTQ